MTLHCARCPGVDNEHRSSAIVPHFCAGDERDTTDTHSMLYNPFRVNHNKSKKNVSACHAYGSPVGHASSPQNSILRPRQGKKMRSIPDSNWGYWKLLRYNQNPE